MTTWQYKLTPFIHQRKNFVGLVFVLEGDHRKFFPDENFPIYSNCQFLVCSHTSKWRVLAYHSDTSSHGPGGQVLAEVRSHHSVVAVSLHHPAPDYTMFARLQVAPFCRRKGEKGRERHKHRWSLAIKSFRCDERRCYWDYTMCVFTRDSFKFL